MILTALVYLPVTTGDFVRWDDQFYVEENALLQDTAGLAKIWNPISREAPQFYPLLFTSYWIEYRLWGLNAAGYHIVNVALHLANTALVAALFRAMGTNPWVALGGAALFALHPVQVASVAWIAERKNTLSGLFYLLSFLLYLRHRKRGDRRSYLLCLAAFTAALLSKTQTATLPISLVLADLALQQIGRVKRIPFAQLVARLTPMLALCALSGIVTVYFEQEAHTPRFAAVERVLIAANAAWFYAGSFFLPIHLSPIYRSWQIQPAQPAWWIAVVAWMAAAAALAFGWKRIDPLVRWSLAQFYIVLLPVLGFISFNFQVYSFVADHFMYLACIGGGLGMALLAEQAVLRFGGDMQTRRVLTASACAVLAVCAAQTFTETTHWRNNRTFWTRVRERDPGGFLGPFNLGNHYRLLGDWKHAVGYYREAAAARPHVDYPFRRYIEALRNSEGPQAALTVCNEKLRLNPNFAPAYLERAKSYEALGRSEEANRDYERLRRLENR